MTSLANRPVENVPTARCGGPYIERPRPFHRDRLVLASAQGLMDLPPRLHVT